MFLVSNCLGFSVFLVCFFMCFWHLSVLVLVYFWFIYFWLFVFIDASLLELLTRLNEGELAALQEQVAMLQDMLSAKDETVVQLTNQIFELESSGTSEKGDGQEQNVLPVVSTPALLMADAKEMETLRVRFFFDVVVVVVVVVVDLLLLLPAVTLCS